MALFSSVSSPLLLEFSLGESVLNEPHQLPCPILHEAWWKLVKGHGLGDGAGLSVGCGGTQTPQGLVGPCWHPYRSALLRWALLEPTWESSYPQYISGFVNPQWKTESLPSPWPTFILSILSRFVSEPHGEGSGAWERWRQQSKHQCQFCSFCVWWRGEKQQLQRDEPSQRAVVLVVGHLHKSGIWLSHSRVGSRESLCACWHHMSSTPSLRCCWP